VTAVQMQSAEKAGRESFPGLLFWFWPWDKHLYFEAGEALSHPMEREKMMSPVVLRRESGLKV